MLAICGRVPYANKKCAWPIGAYFFAYRGGRILIDLYTWTTPNGRKVSIMLEESGLDYKIHPINLRKKSSSHQHF